MRISIFTALFCAIVVALSAPPGERDPVYQWIEQPEQRDPALHFAFVEVLGVTAEQYSYATSTNGKVSDDDGKTWYNLLKVRSGMATLKVIESPGMGMPPTIAVGFVRHHYIPTPGTPWVDRLVVPGARLLGFFKEQSPDKWVLDLPGFIDPVDYLLVATPGRPDGVQELFKTKLADKEAVASGRRERDQAVQKARFRREAAQIGGGGAVDRAGAADGSQPSGPEANRTSATAPVAPSDGPSRKETWSEIVDGVRARLVIEYGPDVCGAEMALVYLEIRNVSEDTTPREVWFQTQPSQFKWQLLDEHANPVPETRADASIMIPPPYWITLPHDSTLRFRVSVSGYGISPNGGIALQLPGAFWQIAPEKGLYYLTATFTSVPEEGERKRSWKGTLFLPKAALPPK